MNASETEELKSYIANRFTRRISNPEAEKYSDTWELWLKENKSAGEILNEHIIPKRPLEFNEPDEISISIEDTYAGRIPIVIIGNDIDFENFIVNAAYRGSRPDDISQMGASFLYGRSITLLALSKKFYSNTPPERLNLSPEDWRNKSMILRREHETVHYYTKRFYGTASNNIHDELIADFFGMKKALGYYDSELFCWFMGIDGSHEGRLSLYTTGISDNIRHEIAEIARRCSRYLEKIQSKIADPPSGIDDLCVQGINEILKKSV